MEGRIKLQRRPLVRIPKMNYERLYEVCHEKTDLIPKEGWAHWHTNFLEFESSDFIDHIL